MNFEKNRSQINDIAVPKLIGQFKNYDAQSGMLEEIRNNADNTRLWQLNAHNARGQVTRTILGNGFRQNRNYDSYGLPKTVRDVKGSGTSQQSALRMDYSFDAQRGVLDRRRNIDLDWAEDFQYDSLDRLTVISGAVQKTQTYDNRGRITNNTDLGDYTYANDKAYRLAGLDLNDKGGEFYKDRERREITYNAFKKPVDIYEENSGRVSFGYSPLMHRSHAWYGGLDEDKAQRRYHKHYSGIGPMEIVQDTETGNTKIITYIGGNAYSATVVHIKQSTPPAGEPEGAYHYLHRDYLGSIMAITNAAGDIVEQTQFGAWGRVDRHLRNGTETAFGQDTLLGRGYTGHEHFFSVGLIHMNGRMYDARLGRFLSPDNFVQDPYNTQNFDRYGYVLNNPLIFSDPSGEFWNIVIGGAIGGIVAAFQPGANFGSIVQGVIIGAAAALVGTGVGNVVAGGSFFGAATSTAGFTSGFTSGFMGGFAGAFTGSSLSTWANGGSFGDGFGNGVGSGFIGGYSGGIINGAFSGVKAVSKDGDFWSGNGTILNYTSSDIQTGEIQVGEGMTYSSEYAREFSNNNFGEIDGLNRLIVDGSIPEGADFNVVGDRVYYIGEEVFASAVKSGDNQWDVFLYKVAFTSKEKLFLTMGHEYLHVAHGVAGLRRLPRTAHQSIRKWEYLQAKKWGFQVDYYYNAWQEYTGFVNQKYDYTNFGFKLINNRPK